MIVPGMVLRRRSQYASSPAIVLIVACEPQQCVLPAASVGQVTLFYGNRLIYLEENTVERWLCQASTTLLFTPKRRQHGTDDRAG